MNANARVSGDTIHGYSGCSLARLLQPRVLKSSPSVCDHLGTAGTECFNASPEAYKWWFRPVILAFQKLFQKTRTETRLCYITVSKRIKLGGQRACGCSSVGKIPSRC